MRYHGAGIRLFAEEPLFEYLDEGTRAIHHSVWHEEKYYLLNANEQDYVNYLVSRVRLDAVESYFDKAFVSEREQMSDVRMPEVDGFDFARVLRARFPSLPVVLITGLPIIDEDAVPRNVVVLKKPVEIGAINDLINELAHR